ncbi:MAG TPA: His/Gly/Thr/Pro-type tRNA ligase C-terminal domain-containing protein, partial [Bacteroidales bacterium]
HAQFSGKKITYFDPELNQSYVPYVIETSIGVDRMVLLALANGYAEEKVAKEDGTTDERVVLRIPPALAPVKLAVLPLVKKDGLDEKAQQIVKALRFEFNCQYDEKDSIGRRYRRQDAIGTPYCITVDHQTMQDDTVTIRNRDTMQQERIPIAGLQKYMGDKVSIRSMLEKI